MADRRRTNAVSRVMAAPINFRPAPGELLPSGRVRSVGEVYTGEQPVGEVIGGGPGGRVTGTVGVTGVPGTGGNFPALVGAAPVPAATAIPVSTFDRTPFINERTGIVARQSQLQDNLRALAGRTDRYGKMESKRLDNEIKLLTQQARQSLAEEHSAAMEHSHNVTLDTKQNRNIVTQQDYQGLLRDLESIQAKRGTPEYETAYLKTVLAHGDALSTKAGQTAATLYSSTHDDQAARAARVAAAHPEVVPVLTGLSAKGVEQYKFVPKGKALEKPTAELQKATGLTPQEFASLDPNTQTRAGGILDPKTGTLHLGQTGFDATGKPKGTFTNDTSLLIPPEHKNKPWEQVPEDVKSKIQADITGGGAVQIDTGKGYSVTVPRTQFENFQRQFGPSATTAAPTAPAPTAPIALAPAAVAPPAEALQPAPEGATAAESVRAGIARGAIVLSPEQAAARAARGEISAPAEQPVAAPPPPPAVPPPGSAEAAAAIGGVPPPAQPAAAVQAPRVRRYNPETGMLE